ncbi:MAG: cation:proton antiporter [Candidatus Diapherotrites archaeon]|nr:cation:proton antiporter [Candidatus Diapherotrites archaeon]
MIFRMPDVYFLFLFVAVIIFSGFAGQMIFKRTSLSDIILLMVFGLLLGPVLKVFPVEVIGLFRDSAPFLGSLTLAFIMFESGLRLNFHNVLKSLQSSTMFTALVFFLSLLFVTAILSFLGWNFFAAMFVGAVFGGTSTAMVVHLVRKSSASEQTKILLEMESVITDIFTITTAFVIIEVVSLKTISVQSIAQSVMGAFSIPIFAAAILAILWLKALRDFTTTSKHQYLLTLAILFFLFAVVEYAKGNGAMAALVFGLVLGNASGIMAFLGMRQSSLGVSTVSLHSELTFFTRTFFFIYLGIIFSLDAFSAEIIFVSIAAFAGMALARFVAVKILVFFNKRLCPDRLLISTTMSKGLAAAVMATYPASAGVNFGGFEKIIILLGFIIIFYSNIVSTIGLFVFEKRAASKTEKPPVPQVKIEEMKI